MAPLLLAVLAVLHFVVGSGDPRPVPPAAEGQSQEDVAPARPDTTEDVVGIRIRAVGDVMLGTDFPSPQYLPPDGGLSSLSAVRDLLADADLTFVNLEGPLLDGGTTTKCAPNSTSCYAFRTPTSYARLLADAGVDLASLANNHAQDFGEEGREATIRVLDALGIHWSGPAGTFASLEHNGLRVGFVAYHTADHSNYLNDEDRAAEFVGEIAANHDVVIVSFHGGAEGRAMHVPHEREFFLGENRGHLRLFTHAVVDAGADLVIGHGPHVPRGIEVYKGRLIAYSLGNFATYGRFNLRGANGLAPILDATLAPDGAFVQGKIIAARQIGEGIPEPDPTGRVIEVMKELTESDFPDSEVFLTDDGVICLRDRGPGQ